MKFKNLLFVCISIIAFLNFVGCEKKSEWVQINSVSADAAVRQHMDTLLVESSSCLEGLSGDYAVRAIYSDSNFGSIDNCHDVSSINFGAHTLIVGKVRVYSDGDEIKSVTLSLKGNTYKVDVLLDPCVSGCNSIVSSKYFYKLYPQLNTGAKFEINVN